MRDQKLTPAKRAEIKRQADQGFSNIYLARRFEVSVSLVSQIRQGRWLNSNGEYRINGL